MNKRLFIKYKTSNVSLREMVKEQHHYNTTNILGYCVAIKSVALGDV